MSDAERIAKRKTGQPQQRRVRVGLEGERTKDEVSRETWIPQDDCSVDNFHYVWFKHGTFEVACRCLTDFYEND